MATYSVIVCFELNASPVVSVAPPQVAVHPGDDIVFTLESPNDAAAKFYRDLKDSSSPPRPLVAWGGGGDWDTHQDHLKSVTWGVTWDGPAHTSFHMTAPAVGAEYEYAGVFTYTVAVEASDGRIYYAGDPTIVNENP
jgi:hypothetical protein